MDSIYLRQGDTYAALDERAYDAEDVLQRLVAQHPEFLTPDPAGGLVLVRREAPVATATDGSGSRLSLDHLYLDSEGVATLVEVKRSSDTRARREVVAQMLDYAANARASFGEGQIAAWLDETARQNGTSSDALLSDRLGVEDVDAFWIRVADHLEAQRFRLLFVADRIAPELRAIIEFLNGQMTATEVLAIEVRQYVDPDATHHIVVPRLIGDVTRVPPTKRRGERLDRTSLLADLEGRGEQHAAAGAAVVDWIEQHPRLRLKWTRAADGVAETAHGRRNVLRVWPWGGIEVHLKNFELLYDDWDWTDGSKLMQRLAEIPGLEFDPTERRWPKSDIAPLADPDRCTEFFAVIDAVIGRR